MPSSVRSSSPSTSLLTTLALAALVGRANAQGADDCASAQPLSGTGTFAFDTLAATTGVEGQNAGCSPLGPGVEFDVWFLWTAPQNGTAHYSTCLRTFADTKLAVYVGSSCSTSMLIAACNDDGCGAQSQVTFGAVQGTQYLLQLGAPPFSSGGAGAFALEYVIPASTDDCSSPNVIAGTGTFVYDSNGMTTSPQTPGLGCPPPRDDVWFRWTSPATGTATLSTCGLAALDTVIAVYAGAVCPTTNAIACDDDGCGLQSITSFAATAGADYLFQIGSAGFATGLGSISIDVLGIPAHDDCAAPLALGPAGSAAYDTQNATTGAQGQTNPCGPIQNDLWFEWTASSGGLATIETCGTTANDTTIAVYPATGGCPGSSAVACDDDGCGLQSTVSFSVAAGSTWLVQVGDEPGAASGPGALSITIGPPPITSFCAGDGTGSACPCSNFGLPGRGCANSVEPSGALLEGTGFASLSADTLLLSGSGMPNSSALYLQGDARDNGGSGTPLFDGLRCVAGTIVRLATQTNASGVSQYPGPGQPSVSVRGAVPLAGGTRAYQVWYRNAAAAFCPPATANWTNGVEVLWVP